MMMNLMTVLVKKVFISSKPSIVCLLCPPPCGPFSIQESAVGGLSYKVKKNVPWHILAPRRGCLGNHLPLRRVRILAEFFCRMETKFPIRQKKPCVRHSIFRCLPKHTAFLFMTIECSRSVHSIVAAAG